MNVRTVPDIQEDARVVGRVGAWETDQLRGRHHDGPGPGYGQLVAGGVELRFAFGPGRCGWVGLVGVFLDGFGSERKRKGEKGGRAGLFAYSAVRSARGGRGSDRARGRAGWCSCSRRCS